MSKRDRFISDLELLDREILYNHQELNRIHLFVQNSAFQPQQQQILPDLIEKKKLAKQMVTHLRFLRKNSTPDKLSASISLKSCFPCGSPLVTLLDALIDKVQEDQEALEQLPSKINQINQEISRLQHSFDNNVLNNNEHCRVARFELKKKEQKVQDTIQQLEKLKELRKIKWKNEGT
ncbi:hypothetical protein P9112_014048 [Eukaryota sp. TZLM1-RC]